ncbi:hypothetical protein KR200_007250 [Drosophila serrata]|nr:hypothetical protein KR200_007250 [Drosophila serrata]
MAHYKGAASEPGRTAQLMKKREIQEHEIEFRKMKIEEELELDKIKYKLATLYDAVEQQLKTSTIGLVSLDEMKAKQEDIQRALEAIQAEKTKQKRQIQALSFNVDEEEDEHGSDDEEEELQIRREEQENRLRERLRQESVMQQAELKDEDIWNEDILGRIRSSAQQDLILPHHYSFYEFIVTKARGKSGPLIQFDVHHDVRMISDASVEKEESHAGKVIRRSWYQRNKHIFPASRWEQYDPTKSYDKYTIKDKDKSKK